MEDSPCSNKLSGDFCHRCFHIDWNAGQAWELCLQGNAGRVWKADSGCNKKRQHWYRHCGTDLWSGYERAAEGGNGKFRKQFQYGNRGRNAGNGRDGGRPEYARTDLRRGKSGRSRRSLQPDSGKGTGVGRSGGFGRRRPIRAGGKKRVWAGAEAAGQCGEGKDGSGCSICGSGPIEADRKICLREQHGLWGLCRDWIWYRGAGAWRRRRNKKNSSGAGKGFSGGVSEPSEGYLGFIQWRGTGFGKLSI